MVFQNITMNLSALDDIPPLEINGSDVSFSNMVEVASLSTGDYLIFGSLIGLLIVMYLALSDKTSFQDFGYDDMRAINISLASCILIGLTMVSVGWSTNFMAVGIFTGFWLLTYIIIIAYENPE